MLVKGATECTKLLHEPTLTYHMRAISQEVLMNLTCNMGSEITRFNLLPDRLKSWLQLIGQRQLQDETKNIWVLGFGVPYMCSLAVFIQGIISPAVYLSHHGS